MKEVKLHRFGGQNEATIQTEAFLTPWQRMTMPPSGRQTPVILRKVSTRLTGPRGLPLAGSSNPSQETRILRTMISVCVQLQLPLCWRLDQMRALESTT